MTHTDPCRQESALQWEARPALGGLAAQMVKNRPAMQEIWVQSLGWEDCLEEGLGSPLQYSCLENPMDRGAWWATVHGVIQLSMHAGVIEPNTPVLQMEKLRTRVLPP